MNPRAALLTIACVIAACDAQKPVDFDNDGYAADVDCDDFDAFSHPGAVERCDGADNDCDGRIDGDDALGQGIWYEDDDGDGYGDPASAPQTSCDPGLYWSRFPTDCDDANPAIHPDRDDGCDGVDDDCDGTPDDDPSEPRFADVDGDGYGDPNTVVASCELSSSDATDCDDNDAQIHPDAPESCDGIDSDCDRRDDDIDAAFDIPIWYADLDGDGYGIAEISLEQCVPPGALWSLTPGDCDDLDPESYPGAPQRCTSRDTDCDGVAGDESGWFDPEQPWRIPFTLDASAPAGTPVTLQVDIAPALTDLGALDPASVTVALQACREEAARALPAAASDTLGPWLSGPVEGVEGDGLLTVAFVIDTPLDAGSSLAIYLGGPPAGSLGTVIITETMLSSQQLSVSLDPDRGGLIDEIALLSPALSIASQADAREGNGIDTSGFTQLSGADMTLLLDTTSVGVVRADGVHAGLRYRAWFSIFEGVPAVFATLALSAEEDLVWDGGIAGVRPFDLVPMDLVSPIPVNDADISYLSDGSAGVALSWWRPPLSDAAIICSETVCSALGTEGFGPLGAASAGELLVDHRTVAVMPYLDPEIPTSLSQVGAMIGNCEPLAEGAR